MEKEVQKDIITVLQRVIEILKDREEKDVLELKDVSDHMLKDASIYQDIDSVQIAILVYSIYKLFDRGCKITEKDYKSAVVGFERMLDGVSARNFGKYNKNLQDVFAIIRKIDKQVKMYVEEIITKARTTKGSKLFEHGLSAKRAADIMGVSEWELLQYIGRTQIVDKHKTDGLRATQRLAHARRLFNL